PTGSCCAADGSCAVTTHPNCTTTWTSGGLCSPNPCPQLPAIGSCCAWNGTCTETTQVNCIGTWTNGGVCLPNICPLPVGACCIGGPDGTCSIQTQPDCNSVGGVHAGLDTDCTTNPCPPLDAEIGRAHV